MQTYFCMYKFCREPMGLEKLSAILVLVEVQQSWSHTECAQTSSDVQWLWAALRSTHALHFSLSWTQERKDELATPWHLSLISAPSKMISTRLTKVGMLQIKASCEHRYPPLLIWIFGSHACSSFERMNLSEMSSTFILCILYCVYLSTLQQYLV